MCAYAMDGSIILTKFQDGIKIRIYNCCQINVLLILLRHINLYKISPHTIGKLFLETEEFKDICMRLWKYSRNY